jgi:segregation and condensation protein A
MSIRVQLQQFEGPLDLLLYLIRKEEMDIFNINIVEITKQYFEYIKLMKEFDLEIAGDFIAMASTLIHIKSKMLLPQYDENGEVVDQEDPRKELVQKLLEYEKFKEASKSLYERPLLNRDVWARGLREKLDTPDDEIELEDNALFSLIASYRKAVKALHKKIHKVSIKLQSISSRIIEMSEFIKPGRTIRMAELLSTQLGDQIQRSRQVLITFLSLLELGKLGFVSLYQTDVYGDIHIQGKKEIDGDVLSRVEEYGAINNEDVANQLFAKHAKTIEEELAEAFETDDDGAQLSLLTDSVVTEIADSDLSAGDMASDEEILAAELDLDFTEEISTENLASSDRESEPETTA